MAQLRGEKESPKLNIREQLHQPCACNQQEILFLIKIVPTITYLAKGTGIIFQLKTVAFRKHLSSAVLYK